MTNMSKIKVGDTGRMVYKKGILSYPCRVVATDAKGPNGATLVVLHRADPSSSSEELSHIIHETPQESGYYFEKEPTYFYRNEYRHNNCGFWQNDKESCRINRTNDYGKVNPDFIGLMRCEVDYTDKFLPIRSNFTFIPKEEL